MCLCCRQAKWRHHCWSCEQPLSNMFQVLETAILTTRMKITASFYRTMVSWNVKWYYVYEWKWKHWLWWTSYAVTTLELEGPSTCVVSFLPFCCSSGKLHIAVCGQYCSRWLITFLGDQLVLCCLSLTADVRKQVSNQRWFVTSAERLVHQ